MTGKIRQPDFQATSNTIDLESKLDLDEFAYKVQEALSMKTDDASIAAL